MLTRRREPMMLGLFDPRRRAEPVVVREAFERALRPFGPVTHYELAPLTLALAGPAPPPGKPLCVIEGYLDPGADDRSAEERVRQLWRSHGPDLLDQLRGGFSVLIWDAGEQRGLL